MPRIRDLAEWKSVHMPLDGRCTACGKLRGLNPTQWTLLPDHMYCKYCFMANVSSKEEQQRIRAAFIETLKAGDMTGDVPIEHRVIEIHDMVKLMFQHTRIREQLTQQFIQMGNAEAARRHIRSRLSIESADEIVGRYLTGPELTDKYGERLDTLIEQAPFSMVRDLGAVLTTPAVHALHQDLLGNKPPAWLERGMSLYTSDPDEYPVYSAAYVQLLARQLS